MRRSSRGKVVPKTPSKPSLLVRVTEDQVNSERIMKYPEILGLLFVMASAPDTVAPSKFLPIIFKSDEEIKIDFLPAEVSANDLLQEIIGCYNDIIAQLHDQKLNEPPGYAKIRNVDELFDKNSELHLWALGFLEGFMFLEDDWNTYLENDKSLSEEIGATSMVLSFFADRNLAEEYHAEAKSKGDFKSFTEDMHKLIPQAMASYASIGWNFHKEKIKPQWRTTWILPEVLAPQHKVNSD